MQAELLPTPLLHDDVVTCTLLLCLVLSAYVLHRHAKHLSTLLREFFYPLRQPGDMDKGVGASQPQRPMTLVLCLISALACYSVLNSELYYTYIYAWEPCLLLGVLVVFWLLYFLLRRMLHAFIGWVFFSPAQRGYWHSMQALVTTLEGFLFLAIATVGIAAGLPERIVAITLLAIVALAKIALAYKAKSIFFHQTYGYLHLFSYLCALEIAPLLVAMKVVALVATSLMVKS